MPRRGDRLLLLSVLAVATAGLVYELVSATMASYLLGDSVTQWSLVIGVYLSAMGLGSYLSRGIERDLHGRFVAIQLGIAWVGGFSATLLFLGFAQLSTVRPLLFGLLTLVGTLVGLEIPLLLRILERGAVLKDVVARVLAFDYVGSLAASLLFPLVLLPRLGLVRTAMALGLVNAVVALWFLRSFADDISAHGRRTAAAWLTAAALACGLVFAPAVEAIGEHELYDAPVVFSQRTPYQRLTLTRWHEDLRLYIDGNLQFSSLDEYRYHEALVHPVLALAPARERLRVLVLGGGDGLALREILADERVAAVQLVDLDPAMTELFAHHPVLTALNRHAFDDARVTVANADAMHWLGERRRNGEEPFDVAIVDLPDPNDFSLGKLYTHSFYRLLASQLTPDGVMVVQATSPYLAPQAFWCIVRTLEAAGLSALPYHAHVPSFGDWGYVLASTQAIAPPRRLQPGVPRRFLDDASLPGLFVFPADQQPPPVGVNHLNDQLLVHYYEADLQSPGRRG
ncbi:MAG: polyamine aminopropyltransferase [Nannocystaceae bacterium]|nr:polyamine aminopropyltransferase [Nannocystaceae bacterium]